MVVQKEAFVDCFTRFVYYLTKIQDQFFSSENENLTVILRAKFVAHFTIF